MGLTLLDLREARAAIKPERPLNSIRTFDAANVTRLTFDWAYSVLSFDQQLQMHAAIPRLRARSRELAQNDPSMARFLRKMEKSVVGPAGFKLQSQIKMKRGGKLDEASNDVIEDAWKKWGRKIYASLDQRLSWRAIQKLWLRTLVCDGEVLVRKRFVPISENPFGFTLQLINSDQLDWQYGSSIPVQLSNGNTVRFGIERDGLGRHIAYWVYQEHPSEIGLDSKKRIRIPSTELTHSIMPITIGQTRGLPWATAALSRMNMLKGYIDAEVVAARLAASAMGSIERELPKDYADGDPNNPTAKLTNNGVSIEAQPGALFPMLPGDKINPIQWQHPSTAFPDFVGSVKMDIAAALDISHMSLTGDLRNANFSSARVALLDERDTWEELQEWMIEELCGPTFSDWLETAFLSPAEPLAGLKGQDWREYDKVNWRARSFPWIDPEKDMKAAILGIENGLNTRTRELASQGEDFTETAEELKEEQDKIEELGLKLGSDVKGDATAPDTTGGAEEAQPGTKDPKNN